VCESSEKEKKEQNQNKSLTVNLLFLYIFLFFSEFFNQLAKRLSSEKWKIQNTPKEKKVVKVKYYVRSR